MASNMTAEQELHACLGWQLMNQQASPRIYTEDLCPGVPLRFFEVVQAYVRHVLRQTFRPHNERSGMHSFCGEIHDKISTFCKELYLSTRIYTDYANRLSMLPIDVDRAFSSMSLPRLPCAPMMCGEVATEEVEGDEDGDAEYVPSEQSETADTDSEVDAPNDDDSDAYLSEEEVSMPVDTFHHEDSSGYLSEEEFIPAGGVVFAGSTPDGDQGSDLSQEEDSPVQSPDAGYIETSYLLNDDTVSFVRNALQDASLNPSGTADELVRQLLDHHRTLRLAIQHASSPSSSAPPSGVELEGNDDPTSTIYCKVESTPVASDTTSKTEPTPTHRLPSIHRANTLSRECHFSRSVKVGNVEGRPPLPRPQKSPPPSPSTGHCREPLSPSKLSPSKDNISEGTCRVVRHAERRWKGKGKEGAGMSATEMEIKRGTSGKKNERSESGTEQKTGGGVVPRVIGGAGGSSPLTGRKRPRQTTLSFSPSSSVARPETGTEPGGSDTTGELRGEVRRRTMMPKLSCERVDGRGTDAEDGGAA